MRVCRSLDSLGWQPAPLRQQHDKQKVDGPAIQSELSHTALIANTTSGKGEYSIALTRICEHNTLKWRCGATSELSGSADGHRLEADTQAELNGAIATSAKDHARRRTRKTPISRIGYRVIRPGDIEVVECI